MGTVAGPCHPAAEIYCEVSVRGKCEMVGIPRGLLGKIDLGVGGLGARVGTGNEEVTNDFEGEKTGLTRQRGTKEEGSDKYRL